MTTYTGDLLIKSDSTGNYDLSFSNGQPEMTNGLESYCILAVFGEDCPANALVLSDSEKMKSTFPEVIRRNVVTDKTKNDGIKAIEKALSNMTKDKIARRVTVTGEIYSTYGIAWQAEIEGLDNKEYKFFINWEKGSLTAGIVRG